MKIEREREMEREREKVREREKERESVVDVSRYLGDVWGLSSSTICVPGQHGHYLLSHLTSPDD